MIAGVHSAPISRETVQKESSTTLETVRANLVALSSCATSSCDCYRTVAELRVATADKLKEAIVDLERIVTELKRERDRLSRAIAALAESDSSGVASNMRVAPLRNGTQNGKGQGLHLTPAGRKRLSEAMKKRWADRRKKGS
jgi:hypothetical protein